jgi:DUF4097 and DUF4098 domain-containing protein YvlB
MQSVRNVAAGGLAIVAAMPIALFGSAVALIGLVIALLAILALPFLIVTITAGSIGLLLGGVLALVAIVVAAALVTRGLRPAEVTVDGTFERRLPMSGPVSINVATTSGAIVVRVGDAASARIAGKIEVSARRGTKAAEVQERVRQLEENPPIEQDGDVIRIGSVTDESLRRAAIAYEITVPAGTPVQASSGCGTIDVEGLGEITAKTLAGNIRLQQCAAGNIDARTNAGNIKLSGVHGGVKARSGCGNIRVDGVPVSNWHLRSGAGNVKLLVPEDAAFEVVARTGAGHVKATHASLIPDTESRRKLHGRAHDGGPLIDAKSGCGNIRIE